MRNAKGDAERAELPYHSSGLRDLEASELMCI